MKEDVYEISSIFKDIDKVLGNDFIFNLSSVKTYNSIIKHLFCRMIDVYEEFFNEEEFKSWDCAYKYLSNFLNENGDHIFKILKQNENYILVSASIGDRAHIIIPKHVLCDDWKNRTLTYLGDKKVINLEKQIKSLEEILNNGPSMLADMKRELDTIKRKTYIEI